MNDEENVLFVWSNDENHSMAEVKEVEKTTYKNV